MVAPSGAAASSVDAWGAALGKVQAQFEHEQVHLENLELMKRFGANAWMLHIKEIEADEKW